MRFNVLETKSIVGNGGNGFYSIGENKLERCIRR